MLIRSPMIPITTRSSTSVNPCLFLFKAALLRQRSVPPPAGDSAGPFRLLLHYTDAASRFHPFSHPSQWMSSRGAKQSLSRAKRRGDLNCPTTLWLYPRSLRTLRTFHTLIRVRNRLQRHQLWRIRLRIHVRPVKNRDHTTNRTRFPHTNRDIRRKHVATNRRYVADPV